MQTRPILVLGATGKTGARVRRLLEARGLAVRIGSRSAAIPFDWTAPETWTPALEGVGAVYISYHPDLAAPGAVERVGAFAAQARAAGAGRLALLSGRGEANALRGEAAVRAAGLPWTIIRSAWFAQNFSEGALHAAVMAGVLPMPGDAAPEPIVDVDDVAEVAAAALSEDGHAGEIYEVTGPRLMRFEQMAAALSAAAGRTVAHAPITYEAFHAAIAREQGPQIAEVLTAIARETLDGRNARLADGVQRALGRPPRDFTLFAAAAARAGAWSDAA